MPVTMSAMQEGDVRRLCHEGLRLGSDDDDDDDGDDDDAPREPNVSVREQTVVLPQGTTRQQPSLPRVLLRARIRPLGRPPDPGVKVTQGPSPSAVSAAVERGRCSGDPDELSCWVVCSGCAAGLRRGLGGWVLYSRFAAWFGWVLGEGRKRPGVGKRPGGLIILSRVERPRGQLRGARAQQREAGGGWGVTGRRPQS